MVEHGNLSCLQDTARSNKKLNRDGLAPKDFFEKENNLGYFNISSDVRRFVGRFGN